MDSRPKQVPDTYQRSALDIFIPAGQIVEPEDNTVYIVRRGHLRVEADVPTSQGFITMDLGSIETGDTIFDENLLSTRLHSTCGVRYRAEGLVVLLPLTREMLARKPESLQPTLLSFVRAFARQRHKLHELAAHLSQRMHDAESQLREVTNSGRIQNLERENQRLRDELRAVRTTADKERERHAQALQLAHRAQKRAEQSAIESRKAHADISQEFLARSNEEKAQSANIFDLIQGILHASGIPPMKPLDLVAFISQYSAPKKPFRIPAPERSATVPTSHTSGRFPTLIPSGGGVPPPSLEDITLDLDDDDGPRTKEFELPPNRST